MTTGPVENLAPEYVAARTVLLDALDALAAHRSSLVLVGARAVYLRDGLGRAGHRAVHHRR